MNDKETFLKIEEVVHDYIMSYETPFVFTDSDKEGMADEVVALIKEGFGL